MKGYFRVSNFDKYQHYKGPGEQVWIKLYVRLLQDYEFTLLPDAAKFHLLGIFLLAPGQKNRLPADEVWLGQRLAVTTTIDLTLLVKSGFIEMEHPVINGLMAHDTAAEKHSRVLSDGNKILSIVPLEKHSMPEERREDKIRGEESREEDSCAEAAFGGSAPVVKPPDLPPKKPVKKTSKALVVLPDDPVYLTIPTIAWATTQEVFAVTESRVAAYAEAYPGVDVRQKLREIRQWSFDNRTKRKTLGGMPKFLNSWMAREQDRAAKGPQNESFGSAKNRRFLNGLAAAADSFDGGPAATPGGAAEGEGDNPASGKTGGPPGIRALR